jgi:hypothetical protein
MRPGARAGGGRIEEAAAGVHRHLAGRRIGHSSFSRRGCPSGAPWANGRPPSDHHHLRVFHRERVILSAGDGSCVGGLAVVPECAGGSPCGIRVAPPPY